MVALTFAIETLPYPSGNEGIIIPCNLKNTIYCITRGSGIINQYAMNCR